MEVQQNQRKPMNERDSNIEGKVEGEGKGGAACYASPSMTSFSYFFFMTLTKAESCEQEETRRRMIVAPSRDICPDESQPSGNALTICADKISLLRI